MKKTLLLTILVATCIFISTHAQIPMPGGVGGGGGGIPGGSNGQIQFNNSGSFGGIAITSGGILSATSSTVPVFTSVLAADALVLGGGAGVVPSTAAFNLSGGGTLTLIQRGIEGGPQTITSASLTAATSTSVNLATGVSCRESWKGATFTIGTQFTGGTGGLWLKLQHNGVDITEGYDLTAASGTFYDMLPSRACSSASTATLSALFYGDLTHLVNLYNAGSVTIEVQATKIQ